MFERKRYKILVVSNKGGVGKSTIAMQIIAPYLYINNNKRAINYYEFDDDNRDLLSFGASKITHKKHVRIIKEYLKDEIIEIFSKNEPLCADIGGNKTTSLTLNGFRESGMMQLVDLVVIPLLDGEQDGLNAKIVYDKVKKLNNEVKILFVLNKARDIEKLEYQFENYFGDPRGIFSKKYALINNIEKKDNNYIALEDNDILKYSRRFGLTVFEIAKQQRDFITQLKKQHENFTSEQEVKLLGFKNYIDVKAKEFYESNIIAFFKKLDEILGNK